MYDHSLKLNPNDAETYKNKGKSLDFIFVRIGIRPFKKI